MRSEIYVIYQSPAYHCWPEAPEDVGFLRYPHRHMFHFKLYADVSHNDRQLEFFQLQVRLGEHVEEFFGKATLSFSCEMLGEHLLAVIPEASHVEVSEDNENGAIVWRV